MGNFSALLSCLLALTTLEDAVHGDADYNSRSPRDLRPRFVKREVQAPIIHAGDPGARLDDEYIVKLRDDMTDDDMTALEDNLSQLCEKRGIRVDFHEDIKTLMKGFTARLPDDAVEILRWLDGVKFVEEDESVLEDAIPWGLDRLDQSHLPLDGTYNSNIGDGKGVNVFVIDSGIHYSHVEFEGRAKPFFDAFSDTKEGADCDGHGTHCAGIIGGRTVGVAPGVNLYSCRVFDCKRQGSFSGVIKGMDVIAASKIKPSVVSMSLRGGRSNAINLAVKRLTEEGYIVVVAAGNDGKDASKYSPASAEEAKVHITPATPRTGSGLALRWQRLTYLEDDFNGVFFSGVVALLLQQDPSLTQDQVVEVLVESSQHGAIDMSALTGSDLDETPNRLLAIPSSFGAATTTNAAMCTNECRYRSDGMCDDGGPGSKFRVCPLGSDCDDCGPR